MTYSFSYLFLAFYCVFNPILNLNLVLFPLIIISVEERTGNIAAQRKTYAHEKKWDANKKNPEIRLEGNASLFSRDVT